MYEQFDQRINPLDSHWEIGHLLLLVMYWFFFPTVF